MSLFQDQINARYEELKALRNDAQVRLDDIDARIARLEGIQKDISSIDEKSVNILSASFQEFVKA